MRRLIALLIAVMVVAPADTTPHDACLSTPVEEAQIEAESLEHEEPMNESTITVEPYYWADLGSFEITAYCGCTYCSSGTGMTASGTIATEGRTIGVDPNLIPLGSEVRIEFADGTIHEYVAEDTGSAVKGNIIDLYYASHQDAWNFGRQTCRVYIREANDGRN